MSYSEGVYVKIVTHELECSTCEEYDEVEVHYDPEDRFSWWTCPNGHENSKYDDEWMDEEDYDDRS